MSDIRDDILPIVASVHVGSLATINEDGSPWSTPLHFAFSDDAVYWLSSDQTQHSRNIERDQRVSIVVWGSEPPPNVKGVYVHSSARKLDGIEAVAARQVYAARFGGTIPENFAAADIYGAPLGDVDESKTRGSRIHFRSG